MRHLIFALALLAVPFGSARAGDFAERQILGFSEDGDRFAFEEFGIQDGSGFPYSNLFVIDTTRDGWVDGSPVRGLSEDETASLSSVRKSVAERAAPLLDSIDQPGSLLASNPITEIGRDPYTLDFKRYPELLLPTPDLTLTLEKIALDAPGNDDAAYKTYGFRLKLTSDGKETVLHEDKTLPASRGTVLDYRIHDVVIRQRFGQPATLAVIIMVLQRGFEGPNGRYMAVTAELPT